MIFMKLRSRSSRATGPKMRVPRGLLAWARRTAAFSSKRISEPSGRLYSLFTRTTTALTTSPFFTCPPAFLPRERTRFGDADKVAHPAFVLLVVHLEAGALLDGLAIQAVRLGRADLHDDR